MGIEEVMRRAARLIVVGEQRDYQTMAAAQEAANTGQCGLHDCSLEYFLAGDPAYCREISARNAKPQAFENGGDNAYDCQPGTGEEHEWRACLPARMGCSR